MYKQYALLALLLFPLIAQSQADFSNIFLFMENESEPELFYLDPNYDQSNRISYYSLGDILKVEYKYDHQHRPTDKTTYVIDKDDLVWKQSMTTVFNYRDNKLVSEVTTLFSSAAVEVCNIKKMISYNETQSIDTIRMEYKEVKVSKTVKILFPIIVTIVAGIIAPISVTLIGLLMFGNLIKECGVLERLSQSAQNELANLVTLLLGTTMTAESFLNVETAMIMGLGLFAFVFDTAGGVFFAKLLNLFVKRKYNPMVGAAGISAFPMSARVIQRLAKDEDPTNFILMQAVSANVAGQIGSIIAGSMVLALLS